MGSSSSHGSNPIAYSQISAIRKDRYETITMGTRWDENEDTDKVGDDDENEDVDGEGNDDDSRDKNSSKDCSRTVIRDKDSGENSEGNTDKNSKDGSRDWDWDRLG